MVYDNRAFVEARKATGVGLAVCGWQELSPANQAAIRKVDRPRKDYDSGKALTLLMAARGARIRFRQSDNLKHIGGFTEVGARRMPSCTAAAVWTAWRIRWAASRAALILSIADAWHAIRIGPKDNGLRENLNLASRIRRRTTTARYFYLLIVGLMDDKPVPAVPMLGDRVAERRLTEATADIRALISSVRQQPRALAGPGLSTTRSQAATSRP